MAPAQMALPVERRNGASHSRPVPVPPPRPVQPSAAEVEDQVVNVEAPHVEDVGPAAGVAVVPVWVQRITTGAVLSVALVAAIAS